MSKQKMFQIIGIQWQVSEHCTGILAFEIVVKMIKTKSPQIIPQRNRFSSQRSCVSLSDSDRKNPTDFQSKETEERSWFHLKRWNVTYAIRHILNHWSSIKTALKNDKKSRKIIRIRRKSQHKCAYSLYQHWLKSLLHKNNPQSNYYRSQISRLA